MAFRGVLFDWRGTLFHDLSDEEWVRISAQALGRHLSDAEIRGINTAIAQAENDSGVRDAKLRADASPSAHRAASLLHFRRAGLDDDLALSIYERDGMLDASFPYPDAARVLRQLKEKKM